MIAKHQMASVVVIGAGQAAASCVGALRRHGFVGRIQIISNEQNIFYERPPLSKAVVLDASHVIEQCMIFSPEKIDALQLEIIFGTAIAIDRQNRHVSVKTHANQHQHIPYDYLVIATGATPILPNTQWQDLPAIYTLRTYEEAQRIKVAFRTHQRVAFIGGGWISLELAASARQLGLSVTVFERMDRLCARHLGVALSEHLSKLHTDHGTMIYCNVSDLSLRSVQTRIAISTPQQSDLFDMVIVGTGVKLNVELAVNAGLSCFNGIIVDDNARTQDPAIFAIGDVAQHPVLQMSLQTWANANETGIIAARAILELAQESTDIPWFWSDQYQTNIQILGMHSAADQLYVQKNSTNAMFVYLDSEQKITQAIAFNMPRFIKQAKRWMKAGKTLDIQQLVMPETDWMKL